MNQTACIRIGESLLRQKRLEEADILFAAASKKFPEASWPREHHAQVALKAANLEEAKKRYQQLLRLFPDHHEATLRLGEIHYRMCDFGTAARYYREHLSRFNTSDMNALDGLMMSSFRGGEHDLARKISEDIIAQNTGELNMRARQIRANIHYLQRNRPQSIIPVDSVISIGGRCEIAWHLRMHYNDDKAYPFDWWITPFCSVRQMIEDDFSKVFTNVSIEEMKNGNNTARCKVYDVLYHHDFKRPRKKIQCKNIPVQSETARSKYAYLAKRFHHSLHNERVLLLRSHHDSHALRPARQITAKNDVISFHNMLREKYNNPHIYLLYFGTEVEDDKADNIIFKKMHVYDDKVPEFYGHFKGWAELLYSCGFYKEESIPARPNVSAEPALPSR